MKIAVSYHQGEIYEHFGHADCFAIYDFDMSDLENTTKKLIDVSALSGHQAMADRLRDEGVDAVLCGNMGSAAKAILLSYGIVPVVGYCGDADTAAELLILGRLPIAGGEQGCGCGGAAGGCNCGGSCGPDCACGGGCGAM